MPVLKEEIIEDNEEDPEATLKEATDNISTPDFYTPEVAASHNRIGNL